MKISIITVNFNDREGLRKTILSVIEQSFTEFEFLVIDGGSSDGSKDLLQEYDHKIDFWVSEPDNGIYHAMNKGIQKAKGEYLLFLNAGDCLHHSTTLSEASKLMTHSVDIYYGDIIYEEPDGTTKKVDFPQQLDFSYFYRFNLSHQASFIKKSKFDKIGLYNEAYKIVSDWEFFIIAIFRYDATYQHLNLIISNYDGAGISSNTENHPAMHKERDQTIDKFFSNFKNDYQLLNAYNDKYLKQLLYLKNNNKLKWTLVKGLIKLLR